VSQRPVTSRRARVGEVCRRVGVLAVLLACGIDQRTPGEAGAAGAATSGAAGAAAVAPAIGVAPAPGGDAAAASALEPVLAPGRLLEPNPASIDFGNVPRGQVASQAVRLRNAGETSVERIEITIGGIHRAGFSADPDNCGSVLAPGRECQVVVSFLPDVEGTWSDASLVVTAAETSQLRIPLAGVGGRPGSLVADVSGAAFGEQEVGIPSDVRAFSITNVGERATGALRVDNPAPEEFSAETDCGPPLLPGASCTLNVRYLATVRGFPVQTLVVTDGMGNEARLGVSGNARARLTIQFAGGGAGRVTSETGLSCTSDCSLLIDTFTPLTATTENGSGSVFTGWSELPGCGPSRRCTALIDTPLTTVVTFAAQTHNLAFISSEAFPADLGGVTPYDAACNRLASEAGINNGAGDAFVAGVSGPGALWERMAPGARGGVRMDGLPLGDTPETFAGVGVAPRHPVVFDEWGAKSTGLVQTGAAEDGSPSDNCLDWTATSAARLAHGNGSRGPGWLGDSTRACSTTASLIYCLGALGTTPLVAAPVAGRRLWVTREPLEVGAQSPDEACSQDLPAGVTRGIAWIGRSGRRALDLLDPTAVYVRPDGAVIGTAEHVRAQDMLTGPWVTSDGAVFTGSELVWTGGAPAELPTLEQTCNDWTDPAAQGVQGGASYQHFGAFGSDNFTTPCAEPARVYCIEG